MAQSLLYFNSIDFSISLSRKKFKMLQALTINNNIIVRHSTVNRIYIHNLNWKIYNSINFY